LKRPAEIECMRAAGNLVARCHKLVQEMVVPGATTFAIDQAVEALIRAEDGTPSFLGYPGDAGDFPASICASRNQVVVHGIPSGEPLEEGDILSVDIGAILDGWHGDSAWTYPVGKISRDAERLLRDTEKALYKGIAAMKDGGTVRDISGAVQRYAEGKKLGVVKKYVGHGIGRNLHEPPNVPNYVSRVYTDGSTKVRPGLALAIEPMLTLGNAETRTLGDGWTVITTDGTLAAHFEHTVVMTPEGPLPTTKL
jgi:methionyl aminopeptidase